MSNIAHRMAQRVQRTPEAVRRLRVIQDQAEKNMDKKVAGQPVSCKAGCSACCQQWVGVFWIEALAMLQEAKRTGFPLDVLEVERQADMLLGPDMTRQKFFGNKCVFLRPDGLCGVYKARPLSCRAVYVASDPQNCGDPKGKVMRYDMREPNYNQADSSTWGPALSGMAKIRALHLQEVISDVFGPIPVMIRLVMQGKTPTDIREKVRINTGVIGLNEGDGQTARRAVAPDAETGPDGSPIVC